MVARSGPASGGYLGSNVSLRFIVAADTVIVLRLLYLAARGRSRHWQIVYSLIAASMGAWLAADLFELLEDVEALAYPPLADEVLWHLPYFLVIAVTRIRNRAAGREPLQIPTTRVKAVTWATFAYPLAWALGLLVMHMLLRESRGLDDPMLRLRDFLILLASMGLAGLSLAHWREMRRTDQAEKEITVFLSDEAFAQSRKMEALGRLAGGVAHDFNNLLFVMQAHSEMLRDALERGRPEHRSAVEMHKAVKRASSLTKQLLAFSRKQVLESELLDLRVMVREAMQMLLRVVRKDIALVTQNAEDLWRVKATRDRSRR